MNKPSWSDAPKWANYLAMDGDGRWYWYEREPHWDDDKFDWFPLETSAGRMAPVDFVAAAKLSREERP
jgi:hypothetical protein